MDPASMEIVSEIVWLCSANEAEENRTKNLTASIVQQNHDPFNEYNAY